MSVRDFLIARRHAELPVFRRVLEALPEAHWTYTPHDRSPTAASIVWTLVAESVACATLVHRGHIDWTPPPPLPAPAEIKALHEQRYDELTDLIGSMSDEAWTRPGELRIDGKTMATMPVGDWLWFFFFDAIHHRGQLSTYIRPMGGRVPAIYGPSGDEGVG